MLKFMYESYIVDALLSDCEIDLLHDNVCAELRIDSAERNSGKSKLYCGGVLVERLAPDAKYRHAEVSFTLEHFFTEPSKIKCSAWIDSEYPGSDLKLDVQRVRGYFAEGVADSEVEAELLRLLERWRDGEE